jgi:hypothetical protein
MNRTLVANDDRDMIVNPTIASLDVSAAAVAREQNPLSVYAAYWQARSGFFNVAPEPTNRPKPTSTPSRADLTSMRSRNARDAGYADGLAGRRHCTDPLHQVDSLAYSAGYIDGQAAARKGWIPDEPCDPASNPRPEAGVDGMDHP